MNHYAVFGNSLGYPEPGRDVVSVRILQPFGIAILSADEDRWHAILKNEVGIGVTDVHQRIHVIVANAHLQSGGVSQLETVLDETVRIPLPQLRSEERRVGRR